MKKSSTTVFAGVARKLSLMVCMLCMAAFAYAQQRVTGTVTDAAGQPVIGANVIVEGTMQGTTTGVDGQFELNVPAKAKIIVSYIGYKDEVIDGPHRQTTPWSGNRQLTSRQTAVFP